MRRVVSPRQNGNARSSEASTSKFGGISMPDTPQIPMHHLPGQSSLQKLEMETDRLQRKISEITKGIATASEKEKERRLREQEVDAVFGTRFREIEDRLKDEEMQKVNNEADLEMLVNPPEPEPTPPGPPSLLWIQSEMFNLVATIVILTNIIIMFMELADEKVAPRFFWLDQSFMIFYIMEIALKCMLLHTTFLIGPRHVVAWNWLDSIIVGSGIVDMYLQPLLVAVGIMGGGGSLKILGFLRMLRLLRILKIVGMFLKADLDWAMGEKFSVFIMGVIGFNSVLMGLESDYPTFFLWYYVEQTLLVIFGFELACRIKYFGCYFFYHKTDVVWNLLDFIIVIGGVVDQWMMPMITIFQTIIAGHKPKGGGGNMGQIMMMLRMARLLRILRLVRLVKNIPPLFVLVVGIMQAMQGMMWVLVLTCVVLYALSLLAVKLIGHGLAFPAGAPNDVKAIFPSIFTSMFCLFKAMNGDWSALEPLFAVMPGSKFVFFCYTVVSSWGILSILTAVVSENMINATDKHRTEVQKELDIELDIKREASLRRLFLDEAGTDGEMDLKEFNDMVADPGSKERLMEASGLADWELKDMFHFLSKYSNTAKAPVIQSEDFIKGLKNEKRMASERTMLRLESRIKEIELIIRGAGKKVLQNDIRCGRLDRDMTQWFKDGDIKAMERTMRMSQSMPVGMGMGAFARPKGNLSGSASSVSTAKMSRISVLASVTEGADEHNMRATDPPQVSSVSFQPENQGETSSLGD